MVAGDETRSTLLHRGLVLVIAVLLILGSATAVSAHSQYPAQGPVSITRSVDTPGTGVRGLSVSTGSDDVVVGVGESVTVSGSGADGGSVRIYGVGPRGRVLDTGGVNHEGESLSGDGSFEADFSVFDRAGQYVFIAVAPGDDGSFESGANTGTRDGNTQRQNVELIRSAYLGPGSDDQLAETAISTVRPDVTITSPAEGTEMKPGDLSVSGTTNLPDGEILVDFVERDGDVAVSDNTSMSGGSWSVTLDLSDVDPGRYTVYAHNASASDKAEVWILTAEGNRPTKLTPTPRPTYGPTPTERYTVAAPETEVVTRTVIDTVQKTVVRTVIRTRSNSSNTTKSGGLDGFSAQLALGSLLVALLLGYRRRTDELR